MPEQIDFDVIKHGLKNQIHKNLTKDEKMAIMQEVIDAKCIKDISIFQMGFTYCKVKRKSK